jgi:hypothetical protein
MGTSRFSFSEQPGRDSAKTASRAGCGKGACPAQRLVDRLISVLGSAISLRDKKTGVFVETPA